MKLRIFNRGKGWYVSATNYKDQNDKAYMNIHFAKCGEPIAKTQEAGFDFTDIDVLEAKFGAYQGKVTMTIFAYEPILNAEVKTNVYRADIQGTIDNPVTDEDVPW